MPTARMVLVAVALVFALGVPAHADDPPPEQTGPPPVKTSLFTPPVMPSRTLTHDILYRCSALNLTTVPVSVTITFINLATGEPAVGPTAPVLLNPNQGTDLHPFLDERPLGVSVYCRVDVLAPVEVEVNGTVIPVAMTVLDQFICLDTPTAIAPMTVRGR